MEFIAHRINTIEQLKNLNPQYGVEIDLRPFGEKLVLEHDPFKDGESFKDWLQHYHHGTIILNIKSEGIEQKVLSTLLQEKFESYFFLDCSFPAIRKLINQGNSKLALRFSEFETIETIINLSSQIEWVWIDCFSKLPLNQKNYNQLRNFNLKLCLVSPELQGRPQDIEHFASVINEQGFQFDAICTKEHNINKWKKLLLKA